MNRNIGFILIGVVVGMFLQMVITAVNKDAVFVDKPPVGQLITMRGQALVTDKHLLIADFYGKIYDLDGIKMSVATYQALHMDGSRILIVNSDDRGKMSIEEVHQAN